MYMSVALCGTFPGTCSTVPTCYLSGLASVPSAASTVPVVPDPVSGPECVPADVPASALVPAAVPVPGDAPEAVPGDVPAAVPVHVPDEVPAAVPVPSAHPALLVVSCSQAESV